MKMLHCFTYTLLMLVGCWQIVSGKEQQNDEFVKTFVDGIKDRSAVRFSDGQLRILAKMSDIERAQWFVGAVATALPGLALLGGAAAVQEPALQVVMASFSAMLLLGCFLPIALVWAKRASKEDSRVPSLMFDEEGITTQKTKKILWQDLGTIALRSTDYYNGCGDKYGEIRVLCFLDKYNNVMLQLDKSDMLSVSIDNICALAQYYFNAYKERQKQAPVPVVYLAAA